MYGDNASLMLSQSLTTYDLSKWQLVLEYRKYSVFLAPESPFYLLCVIFSLLHFFGRRPTGEGGHGPSGPMVNTPMSDTLLASLRCRKKALHLSRFFSFTVDPISLGSKNNKFRARAKFKGNLSIIFCTNYKLNYIIFLCSFKIP